MESMKDKLENREVKVEFAVQKTTGLAVHKQTTQILGKSNTVFVSTC